MADLMLTVAVVTVTVGLSCYWMGYVLGSFNGPSDGESEA